jgi:hypothetical protein
LSLRVRNFLGSESRNYFFQFLCGGCPFLLHHIIANPEVKIFNRLLTDS